MTTQQKEFYDAVLRKDIRRLLTERLMAAEPDSEDEASEVTASTIVEVDQDSPGKASSWNMVRVGSQRNPYDGTSGCGR